MLPTNTTMTTATTATTATSFEKSIPFINEINLKNMTLNHSLMKHLQSGVLGKIPAIERFFAHFNVVKDYIFQKTSTWDQLTLDNLSAEIESFRTVFDFDPTRLCTLIRNSDRKQFSAYCKKIAAAELKLTVCKAMITDAIRILTSATRDIVEHKYNEKRFSKYLNDITKCLGHANRHINDIRHIGFVIDYAVQPCNKKQPKHKEHLCGAKIFEMDQEEFKELIDGFEMIEIHKSTRRYKCTIVKNEGSIQTFIEKALDDAFPKIIASENTIELWSLCPCSKYTGTKCGQRFSLDKFLFNLDVQKNLGYGVKTELTQKLNYKKQQTVKTAYDIDIFATCPKPDCPNGNGFFLKDVIINLVKAKGLPLVSPVHKCNLCWSIWCAKCNKSHPGRLCPEDDDDVLGPDDKKCPQCKIITHRIDGCFHMNCTRCNVHWCWECNHFTSQTDAYSHICTKGIWFDHDARQDDADNMQ